MPDHSGSSGPAGITHIRADLLEGIPHGFLGRTGGVSTGQVASLNTGLGGQDDPAAIAENRRRAAEAVMPGARLVGCYQIHSAIAATVDEPWDDSDRPRADALVTNCPDIVLGIVTADCAPVLLADREAGCVAAAHAGWRGAHGGILESTIDAMMELGARPDRICAVIGPCIARGSYEVDSRFRDNFPIEDARYFSAGRAGHWQFDLEAYVEKCLRGAGIGYVTALGLDTYSDEERFYSFRRATHRNEPDYGRQLSLIGLAGA